MLAPCIIFLLIVCYFYFPKVRVWTSPRPPTPGLTPPRSGDRALPHRLSSLPPRNTSNVPADFLHAINYTRNHPYIVGTGVQAPGHLEKIDSQLKNQTTVPRINVAQPASIPIIGSSPSPLPPSPSPPPPRDAADEFLQTRSPPVCRANPKWMAAVREWKKTEHPNALVYGCGGGLCGGLGDRLKGIFSGFLLAMLTGRSFRISHDRPDKLSNYLKPTQFVDWDHTDGTNGQHVHIIDNRPPNGMDVVSGWQGSVWLFTNMDMVVYLVTVPLYRQKLRDFGIGDDCWDLSCMLICMFPLLFDLAPPLMEEYRKLTREHPSFVSLQVRAGGSGVTWGDPERMSLGTAQRFLRRVAEMAPPNDHIFLTTDSPSVMSYASEAFKSRTFFTVSGEIAHVERSGEAQGRSGMGKMILDYYMIGDGKFAFISDSGFGYVALWRTRLNCLQLRTADGGYILSNRTFPAGLSTWTDNPGPVYR